MQFFTTIALISLSVCMINAVTIKKEFVAPLFLGRGIGRNQGTVFGYGLADAEYPRLSDSLTKWSALGMQDGFVIGDNEDDFRASKSIWRRKYCFESVIKTKQVQNWFSWPPTYSTVDDGYACSGTIELINPTKIEMTIEPDTIIICDKEPVDDDAFIVCKRGNQAVSMVESPIEEKYPLTIMYDGKDHVLKATIGYLTMVAFGMFTNKA